MKMEQINELLIDLASSLVQSHLKDVQFVVASKSPIIESNFSCDTFEIDLKKKAKSI